MEDNRVDPMSGVLVDGRYQVISKIARGGMATVYLATDLRLERHVALKVLHPYLSEDESFLSRLGQEAKAAAKLSNPHVISVLDQGDEVRNGHRTAYLVMEYLPGATLRDVIREQAPMTPRLALAYFDAVISGLAAAHAAGLVHRDLKPENVLIADDGRIKIGDFGLARAVTASTNTGTLIGTVAYLSPELVLGKGSDARSDIYAAGIVLFELLTGKQPFSGDVPIQVAYQHVNSSVPVPSTLAPGLAEDVDDLVRWCTEADPADRPLDGTALLEQVRHICSTLSAAELDFSTSSARGDMPDANTHQSAGAIGALPTVPSTPPSSASGQDATQLIGQPNYEPTQLLGQADYPTTVYPPLQQNTVQQTTAQPYTVQQNTVQQPAPGAKPLSKSAARKADKAAAKAAARSAATPTANLDPKHGKRRGIIALVIIVVLAVLGAFGGWFFGMGPGALATVPELRAEQSDAAMQKLADLGFSVTNRSINDESIPTGEVVRSEPPANSQQRKFQGVVLMISQGPTLYPVPTLTGAALDDGKAQLAGQHLDVGTVAQDYSDTVAKGTILSQDPAPGTRLRAGSPVNLHVSNGPKPLPVPNVVGKKQSEATDAITAAGLTPVVDPQQVNDPKIPAGSVLSQDPADGALQRGGKVTVVISKGPKMVDAPNQFGKDEDAAVAALRGLGFKVEVSYTYGRPLLSKVVGQDKTGQQPEGSTINLTVV